MSVQACLLSRPTGAKRAFATETAEGSVAPRNEAERSGAALALPGGTGAGLVELGVRCRPRPGRNRQARGQLDLGPIIRGQVADGEP